MINQPGRSDRRDTMMIQAQLTQFSMEVVDGVAGWEVPAKVLPWVSPQITRLMQLGSDQCPIDHETR
jgi:hypothetical protein